MSVNSNSKYIFFSFLLLALSSLGLFYLFQTNSQNISTNPSVTQNNTPKPPSPSPAPNLSPNSPSASSSAESPTPTPFIKTYTSQVDLFQVEYSSDRQVYQDQEASGFRYTFYHKDGNIAVHVGSDWSWSHPNRIFDQNFLVSSQPAFRYEINTQTIVDFQTDTKKYTIQCVHGGNSQQKDECYRFIDLFQLI